MGRGSFGTRKDGRIYPKRGFRGAVLEINNSKTLELIALAEKEHWIFDSDREETEKIQTLGIDEYLKQHNKELDESTGYGPIKSTVFLRNPEQVIIWDLEYTGQVSDGIWENDRRFMPPNRYRRGQSLWIYYNAARIKIDPDNPRFRPSVNVPIANPKRLLETPEMAGRILFKVRTSINPNYTYRDLKQDINDMAKTVSSRSVDD